MDVSDPALAVLEPIAKPVKSSSRPACLNHTAFQSCSSRARQRSDLQSSLTLPRNEQHWSNDEDMAAIMAVGHLVVNDGARVLLEYAGYSFFYHLPYLRCQEVLLGHPSF